MKGEEEKYSIKKLFLAYVILIIFLAIVPIGDSGILNKTTIISFRADHILHALVFMPWAFFCIILKKNLLPWFVWGILYAIGAESIQYLLPYRSFNISDMLSNIIGVSAGFVVFVPLKNLLNVNGG